MPLIFHDPLFEKLLLQPPWKISLPEISPQCVQKSKKDKSESLESLDERVLELWLTV